MTKSENARADDFLGVGIGAPGPLDRERGVVIVAPNLGWRDFPLRDSIADAHGASRALDNDANCATIGEWWQGAAHGGRNVVGITIGTGIGGGLILDGKLYHGSSDVAGEIGHTTIDSTDATASAATTAASRHTRRAPRSPRARARRSCATKSRCSAAWWTGTSTRSPPRRCTLPPTRATRSPARSCATPRGFSAPESRNLLNIFNPDVVVIAGGVTQAGEPLFEPLRAEVKRRAFRPAVDACRIVPGRCRAAPAWSGAVATFKQQRMRSGLMMRRKRLGVIGTFVWDIDPRARSALAAREEWGGVHLRAERARRARSPTIGRSCRS